MRQEASVGLAHRGAQRGGSSSARSLASKGWAAWRSGGIRPSKPPPNVAARARPAKPGSKERESAPIRPTTANRPTVAPNANT